MTPEDARKLLGGYATGTLTEAERRALFEAALEDQSLFDELAREESLRATLEDTAARATLVAALDDRPARWWQQWRPAVAVAAMAGVAALAVMILRPKTVIAPTVARVEIPAAPLKVESREGMAVSAPQTKAPAKRKAVVPARAPEPSAQLEPAARPEPTAPRPAAPATPVADAATPPADKRESAAVMAEAAPIAPLRTLEIPHDQAVTRMFQAAGAGQAGVIGGYPRQTSARAIFQAGVQQPLRIQPTSVVAGTGAPQAIAVRYSVLRREGEAFVPTDPNELKQGDKLALRFTANANGYLSVDGAPPVALTAMKPYTTAALGADQTEVKIVFARTPQTTIATPMAPVTEAVAGEVYVANAMGGPLGFTIQLTRK